MRARVEQEQKGKVKEDIRDPGDGRRILGGGGKDLEANCGSFGVGRRLGLVMVEIFSAGWMGARGIGGEVRGKGMGIHDDGDV